MTTDTKAPTRRAALRAIAGVAAAPFALAPFALAAPPLVGRAHAARALKISHQFPGGAIDDGDFRDRLARIFARDLAARTGGALTGDVYAGASLMKVNAQFSALRKGALDMSLFPLAYAGGEVPEVNIGLMPSLVSTYEQGAAWKTAPVGRKLAEVLSTKGVVIVAWIWQAGGIASRGAKQVSPADAKGAKMRGGSREMDLMLKAAGAAVVSLPSNESYAAMQTGAVDAVVTSSTSLISFRLEEIAKNLTTGRKGSYWFMFEPLLMAKSTFDALTPKEREAVMALGAEAEAFALKEARADDEKVAEVYAKAGAVIHDQDEASLKAWRELARASAWKDYAEKSPACAELMGLAEGVA